jgi:tetratricopeptide (TPR) repeat protein
LVAAYLREINASDDEIDVQVAFGGDLEKRFPALDRMAARTAEKGDALEAADYLEEMLHLLPTDESVARAGVLTRLGEAYERAGSIEDAKHAFLDLYHLGSMKYRVQASERLGLLFMRSRNLSEAREHFEEAFEAARDGGLDNVSIVRLENYLATVDLRDGRVEEAVSRFTNTANVERELSEDERVRIGNNELGAALIRAGKIDEGLKILSQELSDASRSEDIERMVERHYLIGNALRNSAHRDDEALNHYYEGLKLAREHRMIKLQVRILNGLGNLSLKMGNPAEALEQFREGFKLAQQMDSDTTGVELMIGMGLSAQQAEDPDGTIEYLEAALDFASGPKGGAAGLIRRYLPTIYISLGDAFYQIGELERAEDCLEHAYELDQEKRLSPEIRYSLYGTFVEVYLKRGDDAGVKRYMPELESILQSFPQAKEHFEELKQRTSN